MPPPSVTPVQILLVEDSENDAELMIGALHEGNLQVQVSHVEDGVEAIRFLRHQTGYETSPRPDLLLLDLHMPRKNGFEVLKEVKEDPELRSIPVIILTGTNDERAILAVYDEHANCCVRKPEDQEEYMLAVKKIEHFWVHVARRLRRN